jgi:hypothetical protein
VRALAERLQPRLAHQLCLVFPAAPLRTDGHHEDRADNFKTVPALTPASNRSVGVADAEGVVVEPEQQRSASVNKVTTPLEETSLQQ